MKNKRYEAKIAGAKRHARDWAGNRRTPLIEGVYTPYVLEDDGRPSYWLDFSFKLGSQVVTVWWQHPRMEYVTKIEELAEERAEALAPLKLGRDFFTDSTPNYKKVGRSRKKVVTYTMNFSDDNTRHYEIRREQQKLLLETDTELSAGTSIRIQQYDWGRGVSLVYPVELRTPEALVTFAKRVQAHLRGEIDLMAEVADYAYTGEDYRRDHPPEEPSGDEEAA